MIIMKNTSISDYENYDYDENYQFYIIENYDSDENHQFCNRKL